ncbi:DUF58 domain-containing protein [Pectinatus sottacetonis]|uniref:DUF58 domain-containing protein n=1 Tax=Pectinatus sottacetonis TaxID=1002795 RepID=UPI0018C49E6E|nr:DUF58 domain-containing protein [Pectinatus sottacetonis]
MIIRWIIYFFALLYSFIIYVMYSQYQAFMLFALIAAIPLLSFISLLIGVKTVKVYFHNETFTINNGEKLKLPYMIKYKSLLPLADFCIIAEEKNGWGEILVRKVINNNEIIFNKKQRNYIYDAECCGKTEINIRSIKFYALLNLFTYTKNIDRQWMVFVMPLIYEKSNDSLTTADNKVYRHTSYNSLGNVSGIRLYKIGDNSRFIHWKASLAHDEFYVKEHEFLNDEEERILLFDLSDDSDTAANNAVFTSVYNIGLHFIEQYGNFFLAYLGQNSRFLIRKITNKKMLDVSMVEYMENSCFQKNMVNWRLFIAKKTTYRYKAVYVSAEEEKIRSSLNESNYCNNIKLVIINDGQKTSVRSHEADIIYINKNYLSEDIAGVWTL